MNMKYIFVLTTYLFFNSCSQLADYFLLNPVKNNKQDRYGSIIVSSKSLKDRKLKIYNIKFGSQKNTSEITVFALSGSEKPAQETIIKARSLLETIMPESRGTIHVLRYPGWGQDSQAVSMKDLVPSVLDAFDNIQKNQSANGKTIVYGFSMGASLALSLAARRAGKIKGVILEKAPDFRKIIWDHHGWWNLWLLATIVNSGIPKDIHAIENAKNINSIPALFFLSKRDEDVPTDVSESVFESYQGKKALLICDCTHQEDVTKENTKHLEEKAKWFVNESLVEQ